MANRSLFFTSVVLSLLFVSLSSAETNHDHDHQTHQNVLITTELIHREYSPKSPLYSPSLNQWERLANSLQRSHHRANYRFKRTSSDKDGGTGQSELFPSGGEYLMNISVGSPPMSTIGIMDTGSDLSWTQCKPCKRCFKQQGPLFDSQNSPTYKPFPCNAKECKYLRKDGFCDKKKQLCGYNYTYGDNSFTIGNLALETFTLFSSQGNPISFPRIAFGCGFNNGGIFSGVESGIIGLGNGQLSLVSQMSSSINGKFSYCLVPVSSQSKHSSKMTFGGAGLPSGHSTVSTPLLLNGTENYYYLALEGISVGKKKFDINNNSLARNSSNAFMGNIMIDSGTMLTQLPTKLYNSLEQEMRHSIHLELTKDPNQFSNLCYKTKSDDIGAPTVVFHFDGADVTLKTFNTFLRVNENVLCLAFVPTDDLPIYGNVAQMDFLVDCDLKEKVLSFQPTDCASY